MKKKEYVRPQIVVFDMDIRQSIPLIDITADKIQISLFCRVAVF